MESGKVTTITSEQLDPEAITAMVRKDANGATATFLGTTRDETEGRAVLHLEYDIYPTMAYKVFETILDELTEKWGITQAVIAHRYGHVPIGEISMVVAIGSPHRKEAFAACAYAVDRIKEIAPVWKKEFYGDGAEWVGCHTDENSLSLRNQK
tara:strand:- start:436 stop:894 length:459 start_codon:yes stop_codon:yes gene_type:complete